MRVDPVGEHLIELRNNGREIAFITADGKCFELGQQMDCKEWAKRHNLIAPLIQER